MVVLAACSFDSAIDSGSDDGGDGPTSGATTTDPDPGTSAASTSSASTTTSDSDATMTMTTSPSTTEMTTTSESTTGSDTGTTDDSATSQGSSSTTDDCVAATEICDDVDNDCDDVVDEGSSKNGVCDGCTFVLSSDGASYFAICLGPLLWDESRTACADFGATADLAVIGGGADQGALLGLVAEDHWIGISDLAEEGHWVFVDGTDSVLAGGVHVGYDGWASGQPSGGLVEGCAELDPGQLGWADSPCEQPQPFICQHPA